MRFVLLLSILACICTLSRSCEKKPSLVEDLEWFNHTYEFPCMYSGLVDIDEDTESSMFYWLFRSQKPLNQTKLVLWFAGGPGGSGQGSVFVENGPLKMIEKDNGDYQIISDIPNSFMDIANVIYIDQPLGVGYSSTNKVIESGDEIGDIALKFLLEFYKLHPELKSQDLIIAGNSYAGHFMPNAIKSIIYYNYNASESEKINIYGFMVEDGLVDTLTQRLSIKHLALSSGMITFELLPEYEILEQRCEASMYNTPETAFEDCKKMNNLMYETGGKWDIMDIRYPNGESIANPPLQEYFDQEAVQKQMHVITNGSTIPFSSFNKTVYQEMKFDGIKDYSDMYSFIVNMGIKTIIFVGSLDGLDGVYGTQTWIKNLNLTGADYFRESTRQTYYYKDLDGSEHVAGTYINYDDGFRSLSYVTVYAGGHVLGYRQFKPSKSLLQDMIIDGKARCNSDNETCNHDERVCYHMKYCYGHGE